MTLISTTCRSLLIVTLLTATSSLVGCRSQLGSVYSVATGKTTAADVLPGDVGRQSFPAAPRTGASPTVTQASFAPPQLGQSVTNNTTPGAVGSPLSEPSRDQAFTAVLGDLQSIGAQNPAAQQELLTQLQKSDPKHWDAIVRRFKSTLAYNRHLNVDQKPKALPATHTEEAPRDSASHSAHSTHRPAHTVDTPGANSSQQTYSSGTVPPVQRVNAYPVTSANAVIETEDSFASDDPMNAVNRDVAKETANAIRLVGASSSVNAPMQSYHSQPAVIENPAAMREMQSEAAVPTDWRQAVEDAIAALDAEAPQKPNSTSEAYLHARQRLLHLVAGDLDAAVESIPGLSSSEQDYWSKQLFALSTLLDAETQPELKRRAAAAGIHLGEAQASLQQQSSLAVRNLTFCTDVYGFGAYKERKIRRFKAAEEVALYVEVQNFRTDETKDGYHTIIGTSYQITDKSGNHVSGREFPAVDDYCLSPRRDFHIQYGVTLPERVYPGEYQLELTLTDQLGNKIGRAAVDFEIVEQ